MISDQFFKTSSSWFFSMTGLLFLTAGLAHAGDPVAGKANAGMCVACHGALGLSQLPNAPNLAGQPAIYLTEQLKNYRSGKRQNEMMSIIAKSLTDQQIDDLGAWYASIRIAVTEK
jgi:cytochrome c553